MVEVDMLRGVEFFRGLTTSELAQLSEISAIVRFKKGDRIFSRGDSAEDFYIVMSGKVHLCFRISILLAAEEIVVDIKRRGDVLGWSALVEPYKLTLSAYCDEDCELAQMRGKEVISLCDEKHHIGHVVMRNLARVICSRMDLTQSLFEKEIELNVPSF